MSIIYGMIIFWLISWAFNAFVQPVIDNDPQKDYEVAQWVADKKREYGVD